MSNVIKSFIFLAIGFALGAFTMKYMADQEAVPETGFKPIAKEQSTSTSTPTSTNGFTPISKDQANQGANASGFNPVDSTTASREQALLQENRQLKQRIQYLESQLRN